jgi:hypothetical protein
MSEPKIYQKYVADKARLPSGIAHWMRPFMVPHYDIQDMYQKPTTPRELVVSLAGDFPALFWIVLGERSYLDGPQLWLDIEQTKSGRFNPIERLLCYPEAPVSLLQWSFGAGYHRPVLRHPSCTKALLYGFSLQDVGGPYREEQRPSQNLEVLFRALHPSTKKEELEALLRSTDAIEILQAIAENPSADVRVLSLLWDKEEACHAALARHPKTAPFLLQEFFQDPKLRPHLAQNPALPDEFVPRLCEHFIAEGGIESESSLLALALNPEPSPEAISSLAQAAISEKNFNMAFALVLQRSLNFETSNRLRNLGPILRQIEQMPTAILSSVEHRWRCQQPPSVWR